MPQDNMASNTGSASGQRDSANGLESNLFQSKSFWGMTSTQFLGAFNDNLYKQLMLLLAVPVVVGGAAAAQGAGVGAQVSTDTQGWATFVFSLPFVIASGFAGYLSDRFSKTKIIVLCKYAEVVISLLGLLAFYFYDSWGFIGTWSVLFLMGTHSAFFGPGKYGILPELFHEKELPRANGIILMTTFLAIIFGTVAAGGLKVAVGGPGATASSLWICSLACVIIAGIGTLTAQLVRRVPPAQPQIQYTADCWLISGEVANMLRNDRVLLNALLVSCVFWLVSGITVPTVNRLGLSLLKVNEMQTSVLAASIALGIMGGALLASMLCRRGLGDRLVTIGFWGIFAALAALGGWTANGDHFLGFGGSVLALIMMGVFAAFLAIPLQVFLQSRPPASLKGRMIATMNQANFIGILISGPLYQLFEAISNVCKWPICSVFWMMSLLVLPLAMFYRLDSKSK
jgi:MFS family permease